MPYKDPADKKRRMQKHYQDNAQDYKDRATSYRKKTRAKIRAAMRTAKDRPCADCRGEYPYYVMQFDHRGDKEFTISAFLRERGMTLERILLEIAKCDVVCANCHAERTHQRRVAAGQVGIEPTSLVLDQSQAAPA